ncbi:MAG TPA: hypothetical protein VFQ88_02950 [Nevskiaceae bacterium]|nr:hypothetical protein [Nevskiaceae bacterium]
MKNVKLLLGKLQRVRPSGPDAWRADCPNESGHPRAVHGSLAIKAGADGHILLHCFACNDTSAILGALGLTLTDLFPERPANMTPEQRRESREAFRRSAWESALRVLSVEGTVLKCAAVSLANGVPLNADDYARLKAAVRAVDDARSVLAVTDREFMHESRTNQTYANERLKRDRGVVTDFARHTHTRRRAA